MPACIFHHSAGTPTIHHVFGTQNIPYFITCQAHQVSTTLQAHRTFHISSHVWHTNYPPHYGRTEHTIFHLCYEMCMTYGISCKETYIKYESKFHTHFLHFFSAGSMGFGPVMLSAGIYTNVWWPGHQMPNFSLVSRAE